MELLLTREGVMTEKQTKLLGSAVSIVLESIGISLAWPPLNTLQALFMVKTPLYTLVLRHPLLQSLHTGQTTIRQSRSLSQPSVAVRRARIVQLGCGELSWLGIPTRTAQQTTVQSGRLQVMGKHLSKTAASSCVWITKSSCPLHSG